jgi:hypothetical protein
VREGVGLTLDVFLESADYDRDAAEAALAADGVPTDSTVTTADGGEASVSVDDDGAVIVIVSLTPELAQVVFDVAQRARLAILPADGTPNAFVVGDAVAPADLDAVDVTDAAALYDLLRESEELRGARSA